MIHESKKNRDREIESEMTYSKIFRGSVAVKFDRLNEPGPPDVNENDVVPPGKLVLEKLPPGKPPLAALGGGPPPPLRPSSPN